MAQCYLGHTFANCFGTAIPEDLEMANLLFAQRTQGALRRLDSVPDLEEADYGMGARASDVNVVSVVSVFLSFFCAHFFLVLVCRFGAASAEF